MHLIHRVECGEDGARNSPCDISVVIRLIADNSEPTINLGKNYFRIRKSVDGKKTFKFVGRPQCQSLSKAHDISRMPPEQDYLYFSVIDSASLIRLTFFLKAR